MSIELTALMKHGTWDLVLPPSNCTPMGCKWVFRVKRHVDGSVDKFKARLVAKGYDQRPSIDYKETFSPVVKPATIRTVLSIDVMKGWELRQMDVNNVFLNGALTENVFMAQPPGFKDLSKPNHVCRLKKAIYGLKQARLGTQHSKMSFFSRVFTVPRQTPPSSFIVKAPIFVIFWFMLMILLLAEIIQFSWPILLSSWVICFLSRIWVLFISSWGLK